jgi:hypothetical protein
VPQAGQPHVPGRAADEIPSKDGGAETAVVDALDEGSVDETINAL